VTSCRSGQATAGDAQPSTAATGAALRATERGPASPRHPPLRNRREFRNTGLCPERCLVQPRVELGRGSRGAGVTFASYVT